MPSYSRQLLSGSTNGKQIPVAATATPGTLLHTAVTGVDGFDEVYLWASNVTSAAATLTVEWGGTGVGNHIVHSYSIPANSSRFPIVSGEVLQNGLTVNAFSSVANALNVGGFVNRIQ